MNMENQTITKVITEYIKIEQSLNSLVESNRTLLSDVKDERIGCELITNQSWCKSELWAPYQMTIYQEGEKKDIELNAFKFSYIVKGYSSQTYSTSYSSMHINYCDENGNVIEYSAPVFNGKTLLTYIYSIIIISEVKDVDKANRIWDIITQKGYVNDISDRLSLILEGKAFMGLISEKYPFMIQVLKPGLLFQIEKFKEELSNFSFL